MKKSAILIVSMILCCLLLVGLMACKDPQGELPSGNKDVNEVEEFTEIMTAVIGEFVSMAKANTSISTQLATADGEVSVGTASRDTVDDAFDYLNEAPDKEDAPQYEQMAGSMAVTNLISVLAYVQTLGEVHDVDKIYDKPFRIEPTRETVDDVEVVYSGGYAVVKSENNHKILYFYNKDDEHSTEGVYKYDINYKSEDDFSAKMAMVSMDEIELGSTTKETIAYYFYGDTNGRVLFMMGEWNRDMKSNNFVAYRGESEGAFGMFDSEKVVSDCFNFVNNDYNTIDLELVRSLKDGELKSFTWKQYMDTAEKLAKEFGLGA